MRRRQRAWVFANLYLTLAMSASAQDTGVDGDDPARWWARTHGRALSFWPEVVASRAADRDLNCDGSTDIVYRARSGAVNGVPIDVSDCATGGASVCCATCARRGTTLPVPDLNGWGVEPVEVVRIRGRELILFAEFAVEGDARFWLFTVWGFACRATSPMRLGEFRHAEESRHGTSPRTRLRPGRRANCVVAVYPDRVREEVCF